MTTQFQLFRLVLQTRQARKSLFKIDKGTTLQKIILGKPGFMVRKDRYWAIGNTFLAKPGHTNFMIGLKQSKIDPVYDETTRDFIISEVEDSACAEAFYNATNQILAVEKVTTLSSPATIASYIAKIINNTWRDFAIGLSNEERVAMDSLIAKIKLLRDTRGFERFLLDSYRLKKLTLYFGKSNAFSPSQFRKPLEQYSDRLNAKSGSVTFKSNIDLDREAAVEAAKDAAVSGHTATAKIQETRKSTDRIVKMGPKNAPFIIETDNTDPHSKADEITETVSPLLARQP